MYHLTRLPSLCSAHFNHPILSKALFKIGRTKSVLDWKTLGMAKLPFPCPANWPKAEVRSVTRADSNMFKFEVELNHEHILLVSPQ